MRKVRKIFDLLESHQAGGHEIVCKRGSSLSCFSVLIPFFVVVNFFSLCSFANSKEGWIMIL